MRTNENNVSTDYAKAPKYFDLVAVSFVSVYLISQVSSTKLFAFGRFQFPGAIIIFPIAYIFGDILTEVYGYARTRRVIWMGFFSATLMALVLFIVQYLPPAPGWLLQNAYESILGIVPRVVLGSILGYWAGEFTNSFVLAKMKIWTKGRYLWTRTIGSTLFGQAVDSIIFISIAFTGVVPLKLVLTVSVSLWLFKVLYEVIATPVTYAIVRFLKRAEGIDVYDHKTNFSPFRY
jgi:uncharacterized integral membrane protein (TIGR00697 family)